MPTFQGFGDFPQVDLQNASLEDLRAYVMRLQDALIQMQRDMKYYLNHMDTQNIMEVGGWRLDPNELRSKDSDVGMSTEDTVADDVRFWAGSTNKNTAPWRVYESGKMHATGATIESSAGYPKIVFDPDSNLLAAYSDADSYIALNPDENGAPAIVIYDGGSVKAVIQEVNGSVLFLTSATEKLEIYPGGDLDIGSGNGNVKVDPTGLLNLNPGGALQINGINGYSGTFTYVKSVTSDGMGGVFVSTGTITVNKGIVTNVT